MSSKRKNLFKSKAQVIGMVQRLAIETVNFEDVTFEQVWEILSKPVTSRK